MIPTPGCAPSPPSPPGSNSRIRLLPAASLTWWDYGNWVNALGHRLPSADGTQTNADMVAAYLTATSPQTAQPMLSRLSAHYAILNPEVTLDFFGVIAEWARHYPGQFQRFVFETGPGSVRLPQKIYLPEYYRTMAVRMYNFDARSIVASPEVSIFTTKLIRGEESSTSKPWFPNTNSLQKTRHASTWNSTQVRPCSSAAVTPS